MGFITELPFEVYESLSSSYSYSYSYSSSYSYSKNAPPSLKFTSRQTVNQVEGGIEPQRFEYEYEYEEVSYQTHGIDVILALHD